MTAFRILVAFALVSALVAGNLFEEDRVIPEGILEEIPSLRGAIRGSQGKASEGETGTFKTNCFVMEKNGPDPESKLDPASGNVISTSTKIRVSESNECIQLCHETPAMLSATHHVTPQFKNEKTLLKKAVHKFEFEPITNIAQTSVCKGSVPDAGTVAEVACVPMETFKAGCKKNELLQTGQTVELDAVVKYKAGGCAKQARNLGGGLKTPLECLQAAAKHTSCGNVVMWSPKYNYSWGCRCCAKNGEGTATTDTNKNWQRWTIKQKTAEKKTGTKSKSKSKTDAARDIPTPNTDTWYSIGTEVPDDHTNILSANWGGGEDGGMLLD